MRLRNNRLPLLIRLFWWGIAVAAPIPAVVSTAYAQATPSNEPLIQSADIHYLGGFALPKSSRFGQFGTSEFEYGGHALAIYHDPGTGNTVLYIEGHDQYPGQIAAVQVPSTVVNGSNWSSLPVASVTHNFVDATAPVGPAPDPASCKGNASYVYGMLAYGDQLVMSAACSYGGSQSTSHGVRSLDLGVSNFQGWYGFESGVVAPPRALAGPMAAIPNEWQTTLKGVALTGNCCMSVISSTSAGPSATVFNPADVGAKKPIPGKTVLYYPLTNPVCGALHCETTQNNIFNLTTRLGGIAWPSGTRSVLFIVAMGVGPFCYGTAIACKDPAMGDAKGPHAPPYQYQILAYDAKDLVAVEQGKQQPWDPKPYAVIPLNGMPDSGTYYIQGAVLDPATNRLYVTQDYGSDPRVEVYQITAPPTPKSPINLSVK